MSFLGDAQEFPAIVLTELHIEMLALNLQFFRLDDVIHFSWRRRLYRNRFAQWKQNSRFFLFVREMLGLGRLGILSDSAGRASRRCYLCKPCTCSARCPHGHRWSVGVAAAVGVGVGIGVGVGLPFS